MKPVLRMLPALFLCGTASEGLQRTDTEFRIFQFPADMIPRIDGSIDDWEMVPEEYVYGTDQLKDTVMGKGTNHDPEDLDVRVRVGWVKGLNRLYFLYEAYDDFWNMYYARGDLFEIAVDADRSGGPNIINSQIEDPWESHFMFKGVHAQNYHIFTPPGEGRDWVFVWGCQPWIGKLPYSNHAYSYDFKEGESGNLVLECWITPFDYAPHDGPERASVSKLVENGLIALSWSVLDYDEEEKLMVYVGSAEMRRADLIVTSDRLEGHLGSDEETGSRNQLEKAFATGNVRIIQSGASDARQGAGRDAEYYPRESKVILIGEPASVQDGRRGLTEGARLTYYLDDDRLLVQGSSQERARTLRRKSP